MRGRALKQLQPAAATTAKQAFWRGSRQRKERHRMCLIANEEAILQQQVATIKQNHQRVTCLFPRSFFIAGRENRIMKGAGLGDLRPEDRQRLRQLIEDLALAESEKEEVE